MGTGRRTIKIIIVLLMILVLMIIIAASIGAATFVNISTTTIFALLGALATTFLVYSISSIRGIIPAVKQRPCMKKY